MNSISADLNIMIKASEKASKALIRDFGELEKLQVSAKGPFDFVSNADIKAEKIIIAELIKSKRNYSIISEEGENKIGNDKDNVWIIDPIDGTTNFLHGIPHFAISIALKSKNEIVSGLILDSFSIASFERPPTKLKSMSFGILSFSSRLNDLISCSCLLIYPEYKESIFI